MKRKKPVKVFTLDTETYNGFKGKLKRIAIYDGENSVQYGYKFSDIEGTLIQAYKEGFDVRVWIHNIEFDLRKIPQVFYGNNVQWDKSMVIGGKIARLTCKYYTFQDSVKILPSSLKKLSESFNVEHGKLDLWDEVQKRYPNQYTDLVDFLDRCDIDNNLFLEYLGYDVISLYEVMEKARISFGLEQEDWVNILSTASLSRFLFKKGFKGNIFKNKASKKTDYEIMCQFKWFMYDSESAEMSPLEIEEIIRESYCGGRCEVFKPILDHNGYHYDVNSLYPAQFDNKYPVGAPEFVQDEKEAKRIWEEWLQRHEGLGFITAEVYIPEQHIPPLPVKMGKLAFPTGYVSGTWTYIELEYAMKECNVTVEKIHEIIHFKRTYAVFKNFVALFYPMKEHASEIGDEAMKTVAKLVMNVAYGYTGMRRDDKTTLISIFDIDKEEYRGKIKNVNHDFGYAEIENEVKAEYIQVQIASYVTSYARLVLLDALRKADERGNVYYCDTDSIVCDTPLPDEIVHPTKRGYWDLEGTPIKGIFLRPKVYTELKPNKKGELVLTKKFKGISRDTVASWDYQKYEDILTELKNPTTDTIKLECDKLVLPSIMVMLKNGRDLSETDYRTKKMNLLNREKREINYNENYTKPWHMETKEDFKNFDFLKAPENVEIDLTKTY